MEWKEIISLIGREATLIGIVATFIASIINIVKTQKLSNKKTFINTITIA